MKNILITTVIIGLSLTISGCGIAIENSPAPPTLTPIIVLPFDSEGHLSRNITLQSGPESDSDKVGELPVGKNVHVIGMSPDTKWYLVEYNDAQGVSFQGWAPITSVTLGPAVVAAPTNTEDKIIPVKTITPTLTTLAQIATMTSTRTTTPTLRPIDTSTYTFTAVPSTQIFPTEEPRMDNGNILLVYDSISASLINISSNTLSVSGIEFRRINIQGSTTASFSSDLWSGVTNKFSALPPNDCLMINTRRSSRPDRCTSAWGFITTSHTDLYFWIETADSHKFEVWHENVLLQTCEILDRSCQFYLPQP